MVTLGFAIWSADGERITHHVVWDVSERMLATSRDEFMNDWIVPALRALEKAAGEKVMPEEIKP